MKKQIHYFFTALMFFSRIPCPKWVDHSPDILNKSSRYFSLVGIIIGSIAALAFFGASYILPTDIAIIISMITSVWITGGFHEDGFADVCDGFGGGWTKEKILTIMKDSRLGTYGVSGLIFIIALKFMALYHLQALSINLILVIISGHAMSRFVATLLLYTHEYVRDIDTAKIKPTTKQMSTKSLVISGIFGITPLFFFQKGVIFLTFIPLYLVYWYMGRFFKRWIGGQTGDCAGALQQVAEIVYYISILILWKLF